MNLKLNTLIAAFGTALLLAPLSYSKTAPACKTGKLLDVQDDISLVMMEPWLSENEPATVTSRRLPPMIRTLAILQDMRLHPALGAADFRTTLRTAQPADVERRRPRVGLFGATLIPR